MKRAYTVLGMEVDQEHLARAVERHLRENIPAEQKGELDFD